MLSVWTGNIIFISGWFYQIAKIRGNNKVSEGAFDPEECCIECILIFCFMLFTVPVVLRSHVVSP